MQPLNLTLIDSSGEVRVASDVLSKGMAQQHASTIKLVRRYAEALEEFGPVGFEIRKGKALPQGGFAKATELALLNEQQAMLIISLMKNSAPVFEFKVQLVREFYRMRNALQQRDWTLWQQRLELEKRDHGSLVRAQFGSKLMLERKREKPQIAAQRLELDQKMQPSLIS